MVCNDDGRALPYSLVIRYAPFRGTKSKEQKRARSDASDGFNAAWATRAAAEAAKSDFKAWVDGGMNPNQRAGAAASAMARGAAAASSSGPQTAPDRRSERLNRAWRVQLQLTVHRPALTAGVEVAVAVTPSFKLMAQEEINEAWRRRSASMHRRIGRRQRRLDAVKRVQEQLPEGVWDHFLARCRAAHVADEESGVLTCSRRRGKGRARLLGLQSKVQPDRHVREAKQRFRRDTNDRVAAHLHRNIVACMSREEKFLPVSCVRKFARRARAYSRA